MMKKYCLRVMALTLAMLLMLTSSGSALTLRYSQQGEDVALLQIALTQLGYYSKTIDGEYGGSTRTAVRKFQQAYGLSVDGVAGPATLGLVADLTGIRIDDTPSSGGSSSGGTGQGQPSAGNGLFAGVYTTLKYGSTGERVRVLQRALQALGFEVTSVDGDFDTETYEAVRAFQRITSLTVDGKAGKQTLQKLESYFDENGNCLSGPLVTPPQEDEDEIAYDVPKRTLRNGMSGLDVQYTQQRLYTLGYYTGARDGRFDTEMYNAVKAFQQRNGLTADGVIGAGTRGVLFSSSAVAAEKEEEEPAQRTLRFGMEGVDVAALQLRLKELGYYTGTADGVFGNGTLNALKKFQTRNGLTADGVCGTDTAARLYSDDAVSAEDSSSAPTPDEPVVVTLKFGDKGDAVKTLQRRLAALGYYTSTIDGVYGTGTYNAVKKFQTNNGLTVDGKAGKTTQEKLYSEDAVGAGSSVPTPEPEPEPDPEPVVTPTRTLRYGMTGEDVKLLQNRLIELGYLKTAADGVFSSTTQKAVKAFQTANGLSADGVAGTKTYEKLFADDAEEAPGDTSTIPSRNLNYGDSGDDVKSVQQRLKALGYLTGTADGEYGTATMTAMRAFQQMNSLTATGSGNMATYARLYADDAIKASGVQAGQPDPAYTNLRSGATGAAVIRLQQALAAMNYDVSVTGAYDDATLQAVRSFQVINGLSVDGVAGKNTQSLLYSGNAKGFNTADGKIYGSMGYVAAPAKSQIQLLHWVDDLKNNLSYGDALLAYDPATGISWSLTIIARGRHCDVEPSTKADTAAMHAAFGNKVYWTPVKPVYVRLPDGRWTVATTHNVAHGINPIKDNDFEGQNCVHFLRDMSEAEKNDPNYGVTNQKGLREFWYELTGKTIAYK